MQILNQSVLHCRWILYQLSYQGITTNIVIHLRIIFFPSTPWQPSSLWGHFPSTFPHPAQSTEFCYWKKIILYKNMLLTYQIPSCQKLTNLMDPCHLLSYLISQLYFLYLTSLSFLKYFLLCPWQTLPWLFSYNTGFSFSIMFSNSSCTSLQLLLLLLLCCFSRVPLCVTT